MSKVEDLPSGSWPAAQRSRAAGWSVVVSCGHQPVQEIGTPRLVRVGELADSRPNVGKLASLKAELATRFKSVADDGDAMELVVWRVPQLAPPSGHGDKVRAVDAVDSVRVIGIDNEPGKGGHCHLHGRAWPCNFTTVGALVGDFIAAVHVARRTPRRQEARPPPPCRPTGVQRCGKRSRLRRPAQTRARRRASNALSRSSAG